MALFLSYNRNDSTHVRHLRDNLTRRSIATFFAQESLAPGLPFIPALERALADASAVAVCIGPLGLSEWQKREVGLALDQQIVAARTQRTFPIIPILLPGADVDSATGFLAQMTWVDLRTGLDDATALDALAGAVGSSIRPSDGRAPRQAPICPYRSLSVFREEDRGLFFGRESFTEDLAEKVDRHRLIAVVGPSGSGKSSVVRAGLLPELRKRTPPRPTWETRLFTPGRYPFRALAATLVSCWEADRTKVIHQTSALAHQLANEEGVLEQVVRAALESSSGADRLLLVIDQFEEIFTLTSATEPEVAAALFVERLQEACRTAPVTVLVTIRADFYGRAMSLSRSFCDEMLRGQVNIGPMKRDELQRAIERPAHQQGIHFEPGLVPRILDHVEHDRGSLPLLQFALAQLWTRRAGATITAESYSRIGEVRGAVALQAEATFQRLEPDRRRIAERIFARLVRVSTATEEGSDTRQRISLRDLVANPSSGRLDLTAIDGPVRDVLQSFTQAGLLVIGSDATTGETTVEVAHEALLHHWPRLIELVDGNREFLRWRLRIGIEAREWADGERPLDMLLRGERLLQARIHLAQRREDLSALEVDFVTASIRATPSRVGRIVNRVVFAGLVLSSLLGVLILLVTYLRATTERVLPVASEEALRAELEPRGSLVVSGRISEDLDISTISVGDGPDSIPWKASGRAILSEKKGIQFEPPSTNARTHVGRAMLDVAEHEGVQLDFSSQTTTEPTVGWVRGLYRRLLYGTQPEPRSALVLYGTAGRYVAIVLSGSGEPVTFEWALGERRGAMLGPPSPRDGTAHLELSIDRLGEMRAFATLGRDKRAVGEPVSLGRGWRKYFGKMPIPSLVCIEGSCEFNRISYELLEPPPPSSSPPAPVQPKPSAARPAHG